MAPQRNHSRGRSATRGGRNDANGDRSPSVLRGPRNPTWGCRCGAQSNWACRIRCRCGRYAPSDRVRAAKEEHERRIAGTVPVPRASYADVAALPSNDRKEVERLKKQLQEKDKAVAKLQHDLKHKTEADHSSSVAPGSYSPCDEPSESDVDKLAKLVRETESALGADDPHTQGLQSRLDQMRLRRNQSKPLDQQGRDLESKLKRKRGQASSAAAAVTKAEEELERAVKSHADAVKWAETRTQEVAALEAELLALRQQQLGAAGASSAVDLVRSLEQQLCVSSQTAALLAPVLQAAQSLGSSGGLASHDAGGCSAEAGQGAADGLQFWVPREGLFNQRLVMLTNHMAAACASTALDRKTS